MAKNHSYNGNVLQQTLCGTDFSVDLDLLPQSIKDAAVRFALPTLLRNATAGLASEDPAKAVERVGQRIAAWMAGSWSAKGEASAEPRTSLLARALAEVLGCEAKDAAARIEAAIEAALSNASIDPDSDDDDEKAKAKAIGNEVRKQIRETAEVAPIYKRMRDEAAEAAKKDKPQVSIKALLG